MSEQDELDMAEIVKRHIVRKKEHSRRFLVGEVDEYTIQQRELGGDPKSPFYTTIPMYPPYGCGIGCGCDMCWRLYHEREIGHRLNLNITVERLMFMDEICEVKKWKNKN